MATKIAPGGPVTSIKIGDIIIFDSEDRIVLKSKENTLKLVDKQNWAVVATTEEFISPDVFASSFTRIPANTSAFWAQTELEVALIEGLIEACYTGGDCA